MKPSAYAEEVKAEMTAPAGIEQVRDDPPPERTEDPFGLLLAEKRDEEERQTGIAALLKTILQNSSMADGTTDPEELIAGIIAEIDKRLSAQINLILHNEAFQRLEGTWRGLHYLVFQSPTANDIKIRVLNLSFHEMFSCLKKYPGTTWDQSPLFKLIYESEFGTAGGEPFGCLIGDYYFDETPPRVETLKRIAKIASAAHVPFISGTSPAVMNMDSWQELANPRDYSRIFNSPEYLTWRNLRDNPDSRYIALTLPRVLARIPYGSRTSPVNGMDFEEDVGAGVPHNHCWMNAAFVMGGNVIRAYAKYGWCVRIYGFDGGSCTDLLPSGQYPFYEDSPVPSPLEIAITDQRETELSRNGFLALCSLKNTNRAVFQSGQTLYKAKTFSTNAATKNEELSSKLPCVFAVSRFAHYLKCILRDKIGGFQDPKEMERWLNDWLADYVSGDPDAPDEIKAKYPMAEARVRVVPHRDKPGHFEAEIYLRPHYQLDGLTAAIKLIAQIPERDKI